MKRESKHNLSKLVGKPNRRFGAGDYSMNPEDQKAAEAQLIKKALEHNSKLTCCEGCGKPKGTLVNIGTKKDKVYVHNNQKCKTAYFLKRSGLIPANEKPKKKEYKLPRGFYTPDREY